MAVFHHLFSDISRGSHTCCMATAAYRSGSKLNLRIVNSIQSDVLQEVTFDYSKKKGVGFSKIITADTVPEGLRSRECLWQFVEDNYIDEKIIACESTFALPEELSLEENISLVLEYVQKVLLNIYQIVDVNIHNENLNNPHVHLMSPLIIFSKKNISNMDFLNYQNIEKSKAQIIEDTFIEMANKHLLLKGCNFFISKTLDKIANYNHLRPWL